MVEIPLDRGEERIVRLGPQKELLWRFRGHRSHPALFNRTMEVTKRPKSDGAERPQTWFGG
jgi:hypothetical protein